MTIELIRGAGVDFKKAYEEHLALAERNMGAMQACAQLIKAIEEQNKETEAREGFAPPGPASPNAAEVFGEVYPPQAHAITPVPPDEGDAGNEPQEEAS